jgi:hypothetical protein
VIKDANGRSLAYVYGRKTLEADADTTHVLTMEEARHIASPLSMRPGQDVSAWPEPPYARPAATIAGVRDGMEALALGSTILRKLLRRLKRRCSHASVIRFSHYLRV